MAFLIGFLYFCLQSLGNASHVKMQWKEIIWSKQWRGSCEQTPETDGAWCPAYHVPAVSAKLAEAQVCIVEKPWLSVKSHPGDLGCLAIFFSMVLVALLNAASASPLLNGNAPPSDLCSGSALRRNRIWSVMWDSGTDPHHSFCSFPFYFFLAVCYSTWMPLCCSDQFSSHHFSLGYTMLFFSSSGLTGIPLLAVLTSHFSEHSKMQKAK